MLWVWVGIGIGAVVCLLILLLVLFLVRKRRADSKPKEKESAEIGTAMSYFGGDTVKEETAVTSNYMSVAEATGKIHYLDGNAPSPASSESLYGDVPKKAAPNTRYSGMPGAYSEIDLADRDTVYVDTLPLSKE